MGNNKKTEKSLEDVVNFWNKWLKNNSHWKPREHYACSKFDKSFGQAYIGVRRSGKTIIACLNSIKSFKNICYINFEDPFFVNNNDVLLLEDIPVVFKNLYKKSPQVIILDEIHNIPSWERFARKIIDTKKYQLIITGSSSKLLSSELSSSLTGRCKETHIWPLSFKEYLFFKNKKCKNSKEYIEELNKYFFDGGFPRAVLEKNASERQLLLRQYLQDIIYKDIVLRYQIRNIASLNSVIQYLLTNISSKHSFNSIQRAFNINVVTAQDYMHYVESSFLLFFIKKYDRNLKVQNRNPQKVYCIDPGLRQANAFYHSLDSGKIAENLVFLELKRLGYKNIFYHQNEYEVDFLTIEGSEPTLAVNVSNSNLQESKTYEREISGMLECLRQHNINNGLILTKTLSNTEIIEGKKITFLPIYRFLLGEM